MKRKSVSRMRILNSRYIAKSFPLVCQMHPHLSSVNAIKLFFFYNTEETFGSQQGLIFLHLCTPFSHYEDVNWKMFRIDFVSQV
jgi:hypothetical protein